MLKKKNCYVRFPRCAEHYGADKKSDHRHMAGCPYITRFPSIQRTLNFLWYVPFLEFSETTPYRISWPYDVCCVNLSWLGLSISCDEVYFFMMKIDTNTCRRKCLTNKLAMLVSIQYSEMGRIDCVGAVVNCGHRDQSKKELQHAIFCRCGSQQRVFFRPSPTNCLPCRVYQMRWESINSQTVNVDTGICYDTVLLIGYWPGHTKLG